MSEDSKAISQLIAAISAESFSSIIEVVISKYPDKYNKEFMEKANSFILNVYGQEVDSEKIFREFKFLVSESLYNRLSKKHRSELIRVGIAEDRVNTLFEILSGYLSQYNNSLSGKAVSESIDSIVDFQINTQMPVLATNSRLVDEANSYQINEDFKQQRLVVGLELSNSENLHFKANKQKVTMIFEEFEKLQEMLDKLY